MLDLWRPFLEEKAGADLENLKNVMEDQQAFGKLVRHMLSSMQMAEDFGDEENQPEEMENENDEEQPRSNETRMTRSRKMRAPMQRLRRKARRRKSSLTTARWTVPKSPTTTCRRE